MCEKSEIIDSLNDTLEIAFNKMNDNETKSKVIGGIFAMILEVANPRNEPGNFTWSEKK